MRLLVVGAGSTGAYFGGRLAVAGRDVSFLVRDRRAQQIRDNGLGVTSPNGDFSFKPKLLSAAGLTAPYDAVLLTVKAFSLDQALQDIAPAVGPGTMILSVLNGMRHLDRIAERFGERAIVGCVCKVSTKLDAKGHVVQLAQFHELAYGERDGMASPRTQALDAFMKGAGFDARLTPTISREMWEKWTMLSALGAATCLMRGTVGEIVAAPGGLDFINATLDEVVAIVRAVGEAPSAEFLEAARRQLTTPGSPFASSMYRDLQQGAPIEADQIVGDLLARAKGVGLEAPLLSAAFAHLKVYQNRLDSGA
jgi:2-dehydropantoate 2-reductase